VDEAVRALANQFNSDLLACYTGIYGYAGTAGTNPFASTVDPVADVVGVLRDQLCPKQGRILVIGGVEDTAARKLAEFKSAQNAGDTSLFRDGTLGRLQGLLIGYDGSRPTHTAGTITTGLIAKAATAVLAGVKSFLVTTAASTGACALLVGDIIEIAGHSAPYVVTAACTQASAASDATLAVEPGLRTALAGSEAITVKSTHKVNIACHPQAFGAVVRVLDDNIEGAPTLGKKMSMTDPVSGLSLTLAYMPGDELNQWMLSIFYGCALVRPEFAARLAG